MIELKHDSLVFTFPDVHPDAKLTIDFQRTLRIPDDGKDYPLPPGLGRFPLRHVDDYSKTVPAKWIEHGGVMLPMYQSEALWLNFSSDYIDGHDTTYPFVIKVATGKINAVTGKDWTDWLQRGPQDYMVSTEQPWLDGYCIEKGVIRQFVAMPLGTGYSAEEQITGKADHGGVQIVVYPMKRDIFEKRFPKVEHEMLDLEVRADIVMDSRVMESMPCMDMGLAPGGRMKQEIHKDPFDLNDWEMDHRSRCFIHIANSLVWRAITSDSPPTVPFTAKEYTKHGLPWFEYYSDNSTSLDGSGILKDLKSVVQMDKDKWDKPLPENESVTPKKIVELRKGLKKSEVREGHFLNSKSQRGAMQIGPYHSNEVVLCSADAGPPSQRNSPGQAQFFYPKGKWVGALRNAAARLSCDFLILTTQHGLVEPHQTITPYDLHINEHRQEVTKKWAETIPSLIQGAQYKLMIFYAGGCPRDEMIEVALPILNQYGVALLTFGRPNMFDVDKIEAIWGMLMKGTTDEEIRSILKIPERFGYYPVENLPLNEA